jgi:hypothetical protein
VGDDERMNGHASLMTSGQEKQALLFVNKKKQKTLFVSVPGVCSTARSGAKKFCGAFSKATAFFPSLLS